MSNDQQNTQEQPAAQPQQDPDMHAMRAILRDELENPWGLPPVNDGEPPNV